MVDIARIAGVSLATTSRALNNAPGVATATRERVLAVAEELSYVVSPEASRLSGGATRRVAVVLRRHARGARVGTARGRPRCAPVPRR